MKSHAWVKEFPGAIVVCDPDAVILEMNDKAVEAYKDRGGKKLIGKDLRPCHSQASIDKLEGMMEAQRYNAYTVEKNGTKKLIYQTPWYRDGEYAGFLEVQLEIPDEMPNYRR